LASERLRIGFPQLSEGILFCNGKGLEYLVLPRKAFVAVHGHGIAEDVNNTEVIGLSVVVNVPVGSDGRIDVA